MLLLPFAMRFLVAVWRRLDRRLQVRVLLPTSFLFAGTLAVMVVAAVQIHATGIRHSQQERAELLAGMIAGAITSVVQQGDQAGIAEIVNVTAGHRNDIESISVVGRDGVVVYSSQAALLGGRPWPDIAAVDRLTVRSDPSGGDSRPFAVIKPLQGAEEGGGSRPRVIGWLDVRISQAPIVEAKHRLARTLLLSAVPALLLLIASAWWLVGREAVWPLQRLVAVMRKAEDGDLAARADEGRPDELGEAARCFDATMAALRKAQTELESSYQERMLRADRFAATGELAAGLAHEIKNPLAGLSGALELLADDLAKAPQQAAVVAEMRHQVERLTQIMEGLLSFARPPKVRLRKTDVNATMEKVLFLVGQQRVARDRVAIKADLGPNLPAALADPAQIEQVFLNICLNGVQAMDSGGGTLSVRTSDGGDHVLVEVADSGPGIPPEAREHVFKPFFTTKRTGTGLGLAISARIVSDHGGRISYRCPAEGGTVFSVLLRSAAEAGKVQAA